MKMIDFIDQSEAEQSESLQKYGVLLAERICQHSRIYLYALSSLYVELFQDLGELRDAPIRILSVFDDEGRLEEFLSGIDISQLIMCF